MKDDYTYAAFDNEAGGILVRRGADSRYDIVWTDFVACFTLNSIRDKRVAIGTAYLAWKAFESGELTTEAIHAIGVGPH